MVGACVVPVMSGLILRSSSYASSTGLAAGDLFCELLLRRNQDRTAATSARPTTPPTTPPAIAPVSFLEEELPLAEVELVEEADDEVAVAAAEDSGESVHQEEVSHAEEVSQFNGPTSG